ncbi:hypothetical protein, partial [Candidatus Symbiopectobacterium sp. NZEC135]|uniref:hypothetical protein n=1 Tax=Candidatus Symbiopectobacterium sp. NZEC135 TaxID=2820471 RepID=UPI002226231D
QRTAALESNATCGVILSTRFSLHAYEPPYNNLTVHARSAIQNGPSFDKDVLATSILGTKPTLYSNK